MATIERPTQRFMSTSLSLLCSYHLSPFLQNNIAICFINPNLRFDFTRKRRTPRFSRRARNLETIQVSRMKATLFAVGCKRLFGGA